MNWIKRIIGLSPQESPNDVIITGVPRSGTTLTCFLLSQIPDAVALNEPLRIGNIHEKEKALKKIRRFFRKTRISLMESSQAMARATDKGISDNNFSSNGDREKLVSKRMVTFDKNFSENCFIGVKHNALFTILLEDLVELYPFFAIVRNPIAILGSWNSVDVPVASGSVRAADILEPELNEGLRRCESLYDKQLYILNWYFSKYKLLDKEQVIRYEEIISSQGRELRKIHKGMDNIESELSSRNKSKLYNFQEHPRLYKSLLESDNSCWHFYDRMEAEKLLQA